MRLMFPLVASLALSACSDPEREAAADADGNGSLNAETASVDVAVGPMSIDCNRAAGQAEQAVCADTELAAIDRVMSAMPGGAADADWVARRKECSRSDDLRYCLLDIYATRIADAAASGVPADGMISGPVSLRCGTEDLSATFINSDPGAVHLKLAETRVTLLHVAAASGAKYEGRPDGEPWSFWSKGREAALVRDGEEAKCAEVAKNG